MKWTIPSFSDKSYQECCKIQVKQVHPLLPMTIFGQKCCEIQSFIKLSYFKQIIIFSKVMTQNIIQIKSKLSHPILNIKSQNSAQAVHKQSDLQNPLEYLQPKNYHFFKKQYFSQKNGIDAGNIVYDMREYSQLLSNEQKRIIYQINGLLNQQVLVPLYKLLKFYTQLTKQATILIQKMAKGYSKVWTQIKKIPEKNEEQLNKRIYCNECRAEIVQNQIEKLKNDLQLRDFEDKYDYYKIDGIKLLEMRKLKNYSNLLIKSELQEERRDYAVAEKSISYEQFEEILNLFGSDIHKKNTSFQSGIQQINEVCKGVQEQNHQSSVGQDQLKEFEFFVGNRQINRKLRTIFKKFYNKQNKIRAQKRRDMEIQVNIKQSQVIKQLQKEKKELKMKLYKLEAQRIKQNQQNAKIIQDLKIQISALITQNQQNVSVAQSKYLQYQRKLQEQRTIIQKLKIQFLKQNDKYNNLQAQYLLYIKEQRTESKNSEKKRTHTKRYTDINIKKQSISPKKLKKNSTQVEQLDKSFTENVIKNDASENNIKSQKRLLNSIIKKSSRNTSIMSKRQLMGEDNGIQTQKYATYESIQQKRQQEQSDDIKRSKSNKLSRFRVFAGLSRFNNQNLNTPANSPYRILENKFMTHQNSQNDIVINKERSSRSSGNQSISSHHYQSTLKKLYDFQTKRVSLQSVSFDDFAINYQRFIKEINSLKDFHINGQKQSKDNNESCEKIQNIHSNLYKNHLSKDNANKNTSKKQNKQNNQSKKVCKLEPLLRKSNYFLQKNKKNFSTYESKIAISAFTSLEQSKIYNKEYIELQKKQCIQQLKRSLLEKVNKEKILQISKVIDIFGGKEAIAKFYHLLYKNQQVVLNVQQNQLIMSGMALFAKLHLANPHSYQYLKKVVVNPNLWTDSEFDNISVEVQSCLQNALKTFIIIHRDCVDNNKHNKNRTCKHFQMLKSVIITFIQKEPQPNLVKKQKIKKSTEKKFSRRKSQKESVKKV